MGWYVFFANDHVILYTSCRVGQRLNKHSVELTKYGLIITLFSIDTHTPYLFVTPCTRVRQIPSSQVHTRLTAYSVNQLIIVTTHHILGQANTSITWETKKGSVLNSEIDKLSSIKPDITVEWHNNLMPHQARNSDQKRLVNKSCGSINVSNVSMFHKVRQRAGH